jgi:hypothetical protein
MLLSTIQPNIQPNIGTNPKQIAVSSNSGVIYTVPTGRKFIGFILGSAATAACQINSTADIVASNFSSFQHTFLEGTVITRASATITVIGIEVDA